MNIRDIVIGIVIFMVLIAILLVIYKKYKIEGLKVLASRFIIYAEGKYRSKQGQEKKKFVIEKLKEFIPSYLKWLVTEEMLSDLIEFVLSSLQACFKDSIGKQLSIVNKAIEIHKMKNDITFDLEYMKEQIETRGYIEGFINTDFKENTAAGIKAGMKF